MQADDGTIDPADLGLPAHAWPAVAGLAAERMAPLAEVERLYALWVLAAERGNVSRAAAAARHLAADADPMAPGQ